LLLGSRVPHPSMRPVAINLSAMCNGTSLVGGVQPDWSRLLLRFGLRRAGEATKGDTDALVLSLLQDRVAQVVP